MIFLLFHLSVCPPQVVHKNPGPWTNVIGDPWFTLGFAIYLLTARTQTSRCTTTTLPTEL